jgi:type IV pilus assembly protein PilV
MNANRHTRRLQRSDGFTLVETMVALVVLAIGMLGIAALYVDTLRASRSALVRTQAVTLAADLADRIRANRTPANTYSAGGQNAIAVADLAAWQALIGARVPTGTGTVNFDAGDPTVGLPAAYTIVISWNEVGQVDPVIYELRLEI